MNMCHLDVYLSWRNNKLSFSIPILQVALMHNHAFSLHALIVIVKNNVNQYNEFACLSIGFTNTLNYLSMPLWLYFLIFTLDKSHNTFVVKRTMLCEVEMIVASNHNFFLKIHPNDIQPMWHGNVQLDSQIQYVVGYDVTCLCIINYDTTTWQ